MSRENFENFEKYLASGVYFEKHDGGYIRKLNYFDKPVIVLAVATHAGFAKKAGATREEVRGAVLVSLMTHGVTGIASSLSAALEAYDGTCNQ